MREIEFRGKDIKTGELVYGFLSFHYVSGRTSEGFNYTGESQIYSPEDCKKYTVHTNTIGQYTGRKDKNGTKIYETDDLIYNEIKFKVVYEGTSFLIEAYGSSTAWCGSTVEEVSEWVEIIKKENI